DRRAGAGGSGDSDGDLRPRRHPQGAHLRRVGAARRGGTGERNPLPPGVYEGVSGVTVQCHFLHHRKRVQPRLPSHSAATAGPGCAGACFWISECRRLPVMSSPRRSTSTSSMSLCSSAVSSTMRRDVRSLLVFTGCRAAPFCWGLTPLLPAIASAPYLMVRDVPSRHNVAQIDGKNKAGCGCPPRRHVDRLIEGSAGVPPAGAP